MPSPVQITLLLILAVVMISIAIAWVSYNLNRRQQGGESGKEPRSANYSLVTQLKRLVAKNSGQVSQPAAMSDRTKPRPIFKRGPSGVTSVHFHFELSEGETVRVVAEGMPQAASSITMPAPDLERAGDQVPRSTPAEESLKVSVPLPISQESTQVEISKIEPAPGVDVIAPVAPKEGEKELEREPTSVLTPATEPTVEAAEALQPVPQKPQPTTIKLILVVVAILLAMLAPILVYLDRWRGVNLVNESLGSLWNSIGSFHQLNYPPYFIYVYSAVIGVILLVWWVKVAGVAFVTPEGVEHQKSSPAMINPLQPMASRALLAIGSILVIIAFLLQVKFQEARGLLYLLGMLGFFVGWVIHEVDFASIWEVTKQNWKPTVAFLVFHIFELKSLSSLYSNKHLLWLWVALAVISLAFTLYRYWRRIPKILWVVSLALILYTIRINGWEFSVIGDEYSFFMYAQELAKQHNLLFSIDKLFNGVAVFGSHPFFSSFIQMISVKLFTGSNFGWRFSNLYLSAVSLVFFYIFFRSFIKSTTAYLAVIFLAVSHYIMTFGKIGYNNLQSYFILSLVLAAGAWAVRSKTRLAYIALGISLGTCFYVYPAALYALPIGFLLILFYDAPFSSPALKRWATTLVSIGIIVLPLVLQKDYWSAKIPGTIFYTPEIMANIGSLLSHFTDNLIYAFLSFLYIPQEGHFVASSYIDPLSGVLVLLGLAYLLTKGLKNRFVQFFLVGYVAMLFFVGASHGGAYPPNTRMFLILPWLALLAAAGIEWLAAQVKVTSTNRGWMRGALLVLLLGVAALNMVQAYSLSKQRSTGLQSPAMLFVRVMERIQAQGPSDDDPLTIWFLTIPPWGIDGYRLFLATYDVPDRVLRLEKADLDGTQLPQWVAEKILDQHALVIIYPDIEAGVQESLGNTLMGLGKQPCPINTVNNYTRFILWYSQPVEWVCEQGD